MAGLLRREPSTLRTIARWLYQMALDKDAPDSEAEGQMWCFEDDLALAVDGVCGSIDDVREEMQLFLSRFEPICYS